VIREHQSIFWFLLILLAGMEEGWGADYQKGVNAYNKKDYVTALTEWKPLAQQGDVDAQLMVGQLYHRGLGVRQNLRTAMNWYSAAALRGQSDAAYSLGMLLADRQDYRGAHTWWLIASSQGQPDAQNDLGVMYDNGYGVKRDYVLAYMWFDVAASQGDQESTRNRDDVAKRMSAAQINQAKKLSSECISKKYQGCQVGFLSWGQPKR